MNVGEALALCTARSNHIGNFINGGIPGITCQDLMTALAIVYASTSAKKLVRLKYMGEKELRHVLENVDLLDDITKNREVLTWRIDKPGTLKGLIHLAVEEYIGRTACTWCNGAGSMIHNSKSITCDQCHGGKLMRVSERSRADTAGIEFSRWRRCWGERYSVVRQFVFDAGDNCLERMAHFLQKSAPEAHHPYKINEKIIL